MSDPAADYVTALADRLRQHAFREGNIDFLTASNLDLGRKGCERARALEKLALLRLCQFPETDLNKVFQCVIDRSTTSDCRASITYSMACEASQ